MKRKQPNGILSLKNTAVLDEWVLYLFWNLPCETCPEWSEGLPSALGLLAGQNMNSGLGVLNFFTFFQKTFLLSTGFCSAQ